MRDRTSSGSGGGETSTISENVDSASEMWRFFGNADVDLLPRGASIVSWHVPTSGR